jgi:hypothetical protein
MLLSVSVAEHDLVNKPDTALARKILSDVDRKTLGQLIRAAQAKVPTPENLEELLEHALRERNRLNHAFYRQHIGPVVDMKKLQAPALQLAVFHRQK